MTLELKDTIHFETLKLDRGAYLAEYAVPYEGSWLATVSLVFHEQMDLESVARAVECELDYWVRRYPVAILATPFDDTGRVMQLRSVRSADCALGWRGEDGTPKLQWQVGELGSSPKTGAVARIGGEATPEEVSQVPLTKALLIATYPDIPHAISTAQD